VLAADLRYRLCAFRTRIGGSSVSVP